MANESVFSCEGSFAQVLKFKAIILNPPGDAFLSLRISAEDGSFLGEMQVSFEGLRWVAGSPGAEPPHFGWSIFLTLLAHRRAR